VYANSLSTLYLSGGIYPQGDYTIFKEGSTWYAKNAYGYIGKTETNVTKVVEYCNTQLSSTGGTIKFGRFDVTLDYVNGTGIPFASNIIYEGQGKGTVFRAKEGGANSASSFYIFRGFLVHNVTVRNIVIDGQISVHGDDYVGFQFINSTNIIVENVEARDLRWGIMFENVDYSTIQNCYSHDNAWYNVYLIGGSDYNTVQNVQSWRSHNGIAIEQATGGLGCYHNKIFKQNFLYILQKINDILDQI